MGLPISFGAVRGLLKELEASARDDRPLVLGGARELAAALRRELVGRTGDPAAIREGDPEGALVYVHVLVGSDPDESPLRSAYRHRIPIVVVAVGRSADRPPVPFVPATDVVHVVAGEGFPIEEIAQAVARRLGEEGAALAARLPLLRPAVCNRLVASIAGRNGVIGAAGLARGADLPTLTLNQLRLVLRLAQAYGYDVDRERAPELAAVIGAGLGLRAAARDLLARVPVAGWAVKGAVAYAGTRALGEAARKRFEMGVASEATPPPAEASPSAPGSRADAA